MKEFEGKVAVVTGGASGIGFALAKQALARGIKVVVADIEQVALDMALQELGNSGQVKGVVTDVSNAVSVAALAEQAVQAFGPVHLLFNNAGVGGGGPLWEQTEEDWDWVLGVNLRGVINGVRAFTPQMIAQEEGHIVNTASIAGLVSAQGTSTYAVSKHAVVALSEVLYGDLNEAGANVGVSVLCPSYVNTKIYKFERNRPGRESVQMSEEQLAEQKVIDEMVEDFFKTALSPDTVAEQVFDAVISDQFYILTHPEGSKPQVEARMRGILEGDKPAVIGSADFPTN
ncbi:MAG: NAD(P)-dependent dehydrogenase (short-subunit alcohol dehydrogenase family) [Halioglobus sp.]|jgi:NAD(P)-dependent dehydrogenase (short-subunit alcohol dehydrogenase family)